MDKLTGRIALEILRNLKAREAEFNAEREEWYRSGDGRPPHYRTNPETGRRVNYGGKGWAFPEACVHGSSAWTDYDNICGPCEDGYSVYQLALWEAQDRVSQFNKRMEWLLSAPKSLPYEMRDDLRDWVLEALK